MPTEHNQQQARRTLIRTLLRERDIRTQAELARQLHALGHLVTQSSVSRDLREMQVIKDPDGYRLPEDEDNTDLAGSFEFVRSVTPAGPNLLVIHTAVGAAQRVAVEIDRGQWPEIVGTLSGDDTIFIATSGQSANRRLMQRLKSATAGAHNA